MKNVSIIFVFTIAITLFYCYVGQLVPQKEVHPPKAVAVRADMSTAEMVEAGKDIVGGKGTCRTCHSGNARFPVLEGVGERAKSRREGYSDVDYLAEALYDPNAFIVPPFAPGMPPVNKPPIALTDQEILCAIAYLQSLGGTPSVTMNTKIKYQGSAPAPATPAAADASKGASADLSGEQLAQNNMCTTCHNFATADKLLGPSLYDAGKRLTKSQLYESILDPDAVIAEGFAPGVMSSMLNSSGFYKKITTEDLKKLVDYLASRKGAG